MLREERHRRILRSIDGRDAVSYEELLGVVDASSATLRRDVEQLREAGNLRKIRGGVAPPLRAVAYPPPLAHAPPTMHPSQSYVFGDKLVQNVAAKDAIARAALALVGTTDSLILLGGTTVARFAELLPSTGMTVLTDSLPVANHLSLYTRNRVFVTGGEVFAERQIVLSPFDEGELFYFAARTFFLGCHAVSQAGIMEDDPLPLRAARSLARQAQRIVVLADSSKFLETRSLVVFPLKDVDIFVTDDGITDDARAILEAAGVQVIVAEQATPAARRGAQDREERDRQFDSPPGGQEGQSPPQWSGRG
jgi:DeoR family ulaG and ulaABCDEF operon transcriptional repressor